MWIFRWVFFLVYFFGYPRGARLEVFYYYAANKIILYPVECAHITSSMYVSWSKIICHHYSFSIEAETASQNAHTFNGPRAWFLRGSSSCLYYIEVDWPRFSRQQRQRTRSAGLRWPQVQVDDAGENHYSQKVKVKLLQAVYQWRKFSQNEPSRAQTAQTGANGGLWLVGWSHDLINSHAPCWAALGSCPCTSAEF